MPLPICPIAPDEFDKLYACAITAFGDRLDPAELERARPLFEFERSLAVFDGEMIVGTLSACTFSMTVPGGEAPTAGTTWVAVLPTHRRRGLLTAMMRRHLDDVRDQGEPLAALWASEAAIYGRFGFGSAAPSLRIDIQRLGALPAGQPLALGTFHFVDLEDALEPCALLYECARAERPGMMSRRPEWWEHDVLSDAGHLLHDRSQKLTVLHGQQGAYDGYVVYRVNRAWEDNHPHGTVEVIDLVAIAPQANRDLWRYCIETDLCDRVIATRRPVDDPLPFLLADPRRARCTVRDGLWLRLVDLRAALAIRSYQSEDELVLEVADSFCPWNDGRWHLETSEKGATCERTDREPDLALPTSALAAAYLGGATVTQLFAAGLVEGSLDAVTRLTDLLRVPRAPWPSTDF